MAIPSHEMKSCLAAKLNISSKTFQQQTYRTTKRCINVHLKAAKKEVTIMAPICENQMQINDTLYWNSNTMSFPESGLRTQYKTLATKKLGRNQTLPLPNMKLEKVHKSGKNLANWRYSHSHEMNCPVGNLQNISKAQVRKRIIAANS